MSTIIDVPGKPLGRLLNHDPASRSYAVGGPTPAVTRVSVRHTRRVPVFDQGGRGSCTGNATVGACGTSPFYEAIAPAVEATLDEALAVKVYAKATTLDNVAGTYPPDDTGSSGLAAAKAAQKLGLLSGYLHAFNLDAALDALVTGPVITGVNWWDSFDDPTKDGELAIAPGAQIRGGHEFVVDELDVERQRVWMTNSWSDSWGIKGRAWMTWATWGQLLADDGDATILVPISHPAPVPTPPAPTPGPGAASFLVTVEVAARVPPAHLPQDAARAGDLVTPRHRGAPHKLDGLYVHVDNDLARTMAYRGKHRKGWWAQ
jgi:hypothetical protein